jgi:hypothetical protein
MIEGDRPQPPSALSQRIDNHHTVVSVAPHPIASDQQLKFATI